MTWLDKKTQNTSGQHSLASMDNRIRYYKDIRGRQACFAPCQRKGDFQAFPLNFLGLLKLEVTQQLTEVVISRNVWQKGVVCGGGAVCRPRPQVFYEFKFQFISPAFCHSEFLRSCHSTRLTRVVAYRPTVVCSKWDHRPDKNIYSSLGQVIRWDTCFENSP